MLIRIKRETYLLKCYCITKGNIQIHDYIRDLNMPHSKKIHQAKRKPREKLNKLITIDRESHSFSKCFPFHHKQAS